MVASCARSDHPARRAGLRDLLLLTKHRLVVTSERGLLRRLRLHINIGLNQLTDVAWSAEPAHGGVQLAATAIDGVREHFWIRLGATERVWWLDSQLRFAFTMSNPAPAAADARTLTDPR